MTEPMPLSEARMCRIEPYFPVSRGRARVDNWRVLSSIVYVIRNGLMWRAAPPAYGPHKTLYNRFVRWSLLGLFNRIFAGSAALRAGHLTRSWSTRRTSRRIAPPPDCVKRGCSAPYRLHQGRPELQAPHRRRRARAASRLTGDRGPGQRLQGRGHHAARHACCARAHRRPRLRCWRCRRVPLGATHLRHPSVHTWARQPLQADPPWQAALSLLSQGRDHVRSPEEMAAHPHPQRPMHSHLHVRHRARRRGLIVATA